MRVAAESQVVRGGGARTGARAEVGTGNGSVPCEVNDKLERAIRHKILRLDWTFRALALRPSFISTRIYSVA